MLKKASLLASAFALQACIMESVPTLSPEAKNVTLVNETSRPIDCKVLGKINGSAHTDGEKQAHQGAEAEFRNQAAKMKANYALIEQERSGPYGTTTQTDVFISGKALFCRTQEMEAEEEKKREQALKEKEEREQKEAEEKQRKEQEEKEKQEAEKEKAKEEKKKK